MVTGHPSQYGRLVILGPREAPAGVMEIASVAARYRAQGYDVITAADVARQSGATFGSLDSIRLGMETILAADALVMAPGWENDPACLAAFEIADVVGIPISVYARSATAAA